MNEVWKSFAAQEITHSMAHYLTTLLKLKGERGYARVSDVAKELEVTKGSVSTQMKHLKEKGLVITDLWMPRKDDPQVIRELRRELPTEKIIVMTSYELEVLSSAA